MVAIRKAIAIFFSGASVAVSGSGGGTSGSSPTFYILGF